VIRLPAAIFLALLVSGCGYHLAGGPPRALPQDVRSLAVIPVGEEAEMLSTGILQELELRVGDVALLRGGEDAQAELRIGPLSSTYDAAAFDAQGVATAFKATLSGELSLWRDGAVIWSSGDIFMHEDVYATGGPASIEASKARVLESLRQRWRREAMQHLTSGF